MSSKRRGNRRRDCPCGSSIRKRVRQETEMIHKAFFGKPRNKNNKSIAEKESLKLRSVPTSNCRTEIENITPNIAGSLASTSKSTNVISDVRENVSAIMSRRTIDSDTFTNPHITDSSSDDECISKVQIDPTTDLKNFLQQWGDEYNIPQIAMGALLKKLKQHDCYKSLPTDARAILKTPRRTLTRTVPPGEYYHFGLKNNIIKLLNPIIDEWKEDSIKISINIDELPISKSTRAQFWPILGSINSLNKVFTIGIYYGDEKPADINEFLKDFILEAVDICSNGITMNRRMKCEINTLICDSPAKAYVLCVKQHTGFSSCTKCTTEGAYVKNRVCFPEITAAKRSDRAFKEKIDESYHKENATSSFVDIPNFGPVTNVPLDYMHLICLGIMRKLILLWKKGDLHYRLPYFKEKEIENRLQRIKSYIPREFSRKPRSLEYVHLWKATEFRQILLYSGPVVFKSILSQDIFQHFMVLHVAVRIMCSEELTDLLDYAQELNKYFIESFALLYGVHNISHNVHNMIHLIDDVKKFGPLDCFSAFKYENHLQHLKSLIRKPHKPLQQIIRRHAENHSGISVGQIIPGPGQTIQFKPDLNSEHYNGPLLNNVCTQPQYKTIRQGETIIKADTTANSCCELLCGAIVLIKNIAFCSQLQDLVVIGQEYIEKDDLYKVPLSSSTIGVYVVKKISQLQKWPLKSVKRKCVILPYINDTYAVLPFLH